MTADGLTVDGTATISEGTSGSTASSDSNTLVVENNGNAGMAILTPDGSSGQLRLGDVTDSSSAFVQYNSTDNLMTVGTSRASGELRFTTGNVGERVRIDSAGNVGIGTSSPSRKLTIQDSSAQVAIVSDADQSSVLNFGDTADDNIGRIQYNNANNSMIFRTNEYDRVTIDSSGNVGIGTSSPSKELHVASAQPDFRMEDTDGTDQYAEFTESNGILFISSRNGASDGQILFRGLGGGSSNEFMRIDSSGNVGIGTAFASSYNSNWNDLVIDGGTNSGATIVSGTTGDGTIGFADGTTGDQQYRGYVQYRHSLDQLKFGTSGDSAMVIDSSGNVGIGTDSPGSYDGNADNLVIGGESSVGLTLASSATNGRGSIYFADGTSGDQKYRGTVNYFHDIDALTITTAAVERMRIDASGNLLVGKTSADNTTQGIRLLGSAGFASFVRDGAEPIVVNRLTSDGDLIEFRKDGTTVGSIGTEPDTSRFTIADASSRGFSIYTASGETSLVPATATATQDGFGSIGTSSQRWKDLYLSGGAYLGGTAAANKLDSYEEGTWSPTLIGTTSGSATVTVTEAKYTKVGNMVNVRGYISADLSSHNIVGVVEIGGIPFVSNSQAGAGSVGYNLLVAGAIHLRPISSSLRLGQGDSNNWLHTQLLTGSNALMFFEVTYETNS